MNTLRRVAAGIGGIILLVTAVAFGPTAPTGPQGVTIEATDLGQGVHMLTGRGGNLGVSLGEDGVLLIDGQFAQQTGQILDAIAELSDQPVRFLVNTHWHGDHTGSNANLAARGVTVVAHENVRGRLATPQTNRTLGGDTEAAPSAALPVLTFGDAVRFHWNGQSVDVQHVPAAHTDGDAILHFREADVLHLGDTFFNGSYPFIDVSSGGSIDGVIAAVDVALGLAGEDTKIIPGHGELGSRSELEAYGEMLRTARAAVAELMRAGTSREDTIAARPTAGLDAEWGGGFMQPDVWVGLVYDSL